MTPADRRISELVDRWLASIDAHLRYADLPDDQYWQIQTWPRHDRPTRWVLEVAKQKVLDLKSQCESRRQLGDAKFADALELMAFLANLVGLQHIQRFIPLADASVPTSPTSSATDEPTVEARQPASAGAARSDESTREMPRLKVAPAAPSRPHHAHAKTANKPEPRKTQPAAPAATKAGPVPVAMTSQLQGKIVADAVRLLKWGKEWHELAELIARIAERPPAAEIRKVLRTHKSEIESKAARK